jgi:hypothetical protein
MCTCRVVMAAGAGEARLPVELEDTKLEYASNPSRTICMRDLYAAGPVAVIFLRRFDPHSSSASIESTHCTSCRLGCKLCRVHAQDLESISTQSYCSTQLVLVEYSASYSTHVHCHTPHHHPINAWKIFHCSCCALDCSRIAFILRRLVIT